MIPAFVFKIIGFYDLGLVVFGSVGNALVFLTCVLRLRDQVSFVFIAFLSITDFIAVYEWNLTHFVDQFFTPGILRNTMAKCRLLSFFQFFSLQASAWLLVMLSFDRFLFIFNHNWRRKFFKAKQATVASIACIVFFALLNSNVLFLFGFNEYDENGTYVDTSCWPREGVPEAYWMEVWPQVHAWIYSYVPFIFLAAANLLLLFTVYKKSKRSVAQANNKRGPTSDRIKSVTITVIVVTLLFLVMTGVGTFVNLFMLSVVGSDLGYLVIVLSDSLCFSFHGLNILTLIATNKKFRHHLFSLIRFETVRVTKRKPASTTKTVSLRHVM